MRSANNRGRFLLGHALGLAIVVMSVGVSVHSARGSVTMAVDAKGGLGNMVSIQARYDAIDASTTNYLAGTFTASLNGGAAFDAYCVDLYHVVYVGGGGSAYAVNPLPIAALSNPAGHGEGVGFLFQNFAPLVANSIDAAGLQVALWKLEYDNGGSLMSGHFTMPDSTDLTSNQHLVFAKATLDLSAYHGTETGEATWLEATSHPNDGRYDLYQNLVGPAAILTPEPPTITKAILGLGFLVGLVRKRMRQTPCSATA